MVVPQMAAKKDATGVPRGRRGMVITVTIPNWEKYNPRSDRTNFSWFRFENRFFHDQTVYELGTNSKLLCVFLFCEVSRNAGRPTEVNLDYVSGLLTIRRSQLLRDLNELRASGMISFDDVIMTASRRHRASFGCPTIQDKTDETRQTYSRAKKPREEFDLKSLYEKYPRKLGKAKGLAKASRDVKTEADFQALAVAITRFVEFHKKAGTEEKFIPHFSTFMSAWRDWTEPETGKSEDFSKAADQPNWDFIFSKGTPNEAG